MNDLRWVSCSQMDDWATSRYRHLTRSPKGGWTDTLCGASGTPGAFRGSKVKPDCPQCVDIEKKGRS